MPCDDDPGQLEELFHTLLETPMDERDEHLTRLVPESRLRDEVAGLLRCHESEGAFDRVSVAIARIGAGGDGEPEAPEPPMRIGPYHVDGVIGEGGMATVFRGRRDDDPSSASVALKVLRREADSVRLRRRFMAEGQILAELSHPNIARFLDDGLTPDGLPYLVTELVEGERLDRHCQEHDVEETERIGLFLEVCRAVEYAHRRGVIHRDLKPDNVLVTSEGQLKLLDFGIAKILDDHLFPGAGRQTTSGVHLLTLSYASPEQLRGGAVTRSSDIYQLGLLLVHVLTGRLPPVHVRSREPLHMETVLPDAALGGALSAHSTQLRGVVRKALSLRPEDRHATATALIGACQRLLAHDPSPGLPSEGRRQGPGRPFIIFLLTVTTILAVAAVLFGAAPDLTGTSPAR